MPAAHEDSLVLSLDASPFLLPSFETTTKIISIAYCNLSLAMSSLLYKRALILDLIFFYNSFAFPKPLFELAFISYSAPPNIDSLTARLPEIKGSLKKVPIRKVLLPLPMLEKILEVTLIFLSFFC